MKRTSGDLFINAKKIETQAYKKIIGYVPQEDIMLRELTVKENILHSARIRLPSQWTDKEVNIFVDEIIDALNLTHIAHCVIGDETSNLISGGQRKRVNIGTHLYLFF